MSEGEFTKQNRFPRKENKQKPQWLLDLQSASLPHLNFGLSACLPQTAGQRDGPG